MDAVLEGTRPNQTVQLRVLRGGTEITLTATLRRRPLDVIQPEDDDPLSLLLTLSQVDDLKLKAQWLRDAAIYRLHNDLKATDSQLAALNFDDVRAAKEELKIRLDRNGPEADRWTVLGDEVQKAVEAWQNERGGKAGPLFGPLAAAASADRLSPDAVASIVARTRTEIEGRDQPGTFIELEGVNLRGGTWTLVEHTADRAVFRRALPQWGLEITKTYRLVKVPQEAASDPDFPAYHLVFDVADSQHRRPGPPRGLPARRPQRFAQGRGLVRQQGEPQLVRAHRPARLHHLVRRRGTAHDRRAAGGRGKGAAALARRVVELHRR